MERASLPALLLPLPLHEGGTDLAPVRLTGGISPLGVLDLGEAPWARSISNLAKNPARHPCFRGKGFRPGHAGAPLSPPAHSLRGFTYRCKIHPHLLKDS